VIGGFVIFLFGVIAGLLVGIWAIHSLNSKWSQVAQNSDLAFQRLLAVCNDYEGLLEMHEELWDREHSSDED
jgi:hypothetical protein